MSTDRGAAGRRRRLLAKRRLAELIAARYSAKVMREARRP